ncbi:hypothetical protein D3C72_2116540 [compost metagenome]
MNLGVTRSPLEMCAQSNDRSILNDDTADDGIYSGLSLRSLGHIQRKRHIEFVVHYLHDHSSTRRSSFHRKNRQICEKPIRFSFREQRMGM